MAKKAFVISAVFIAIIIIVSIIISLVNLKPVVFRKVVTYNAETNKIVEAKEYTTTADNSGDDLGPLTNLLKYEKTIMFSTIVIVFIFLILFYGTKRSKGW